MLMCIYSIDTWQNSSYTSFHNDSHSALCLDVSIIGIESEIEAWWWRKKKKKIIRTVHIISPHDSDACTVPEIWLNSKNGAITLKKNIT